MCVSTTPFLLSALKLFLLFHWNHHQLCDTERRFHTFIRRIAMCLSLVKLSAHLFIVALLGDEEPSEVVILKIIDMEFLWKCSFQFAIIIIAIAVYHLLHLCLAVICKKKKAPLNSHFLVFSPPWPSKSKWEGEREMVVAAEWDERWITMKHSFKLSTKLRWNDCHSNLFWPNYEDCKNCFRLHLYTTGKSCGESGKRFSFQKFFCLIHPVWEWFFLAASLHGRIT